MAGMPGSAISSRTELAVRSSLKSQLGSTSRPSAGPTQVSNRTPSSTSPPIATPVVPAILGSPVRDYVVNPRDEGLIVEPAALAVLTAVGVPAVRRQRAMPAVGLLVPGLEERPLRLVARGTTAAAMEVDEGR